MGIPAGRPCSQHMPACATLKLNLIVVKCGLMYPWRADSLVLQAFVKDAKLLQLLKALLTQQSQLAATPATQLTPDMVQQLQQVVQEAEVKSPEAFKLDADQVRGPLRQPLMLHASTDSISLQRTKDCLVGYPADCSACDC